MSLWGLPEQGRVAYAKLKLASQTVEFDHMRFANDKVLQPRQIIYRDLVALQTDWPRHRIINIVLTNLSRNVEFPRGSTKPSCTVDNSDLPAKKAWEYLRDYPGQAVTLTVQETTKPIDEEKEIEYHGVIVSQSLTELSDDKVELALSIDVNKEFYPDGEMILK